jgi:hypothetical protein
MNLYTVNVSELNAGLRVGEIRRNIAKRSGSSGCSSGVGRKRGDAM